jgi:hypothetical protein
MEGVLVLDCSWAQAVDSIMGLQQPSSRHCRWLRCKNCVCSSNSGRWAVWADWMSREGQGSQPETGESVDSHRQIRPGDCQGPHAAQHLQGVPPVFRRSIWCLVDEKFWVNFYRLCLLPKKKHCINKRFPVTSNLRYMHGVLNVDEIKN